MKTILVTDDDPVLVRILTRYLQKQRFSTLVAHSVPEAINVITRNKVDAVILDMNMPGGSGADVIRRMKAFNRTGPIPIVVLSGSLEGDAQETVLAMGADSYFSKPPALEKLVANVNALIARAEASNDESSAPGAMLVEAVAPSGN